MTANAAHHYACNDTTSPYLASAAPSDAEFSDAESVIYTETGWATTISGGSASVAVIVNGETLAFEGNGYHDANWAPQLLNEIVTNWYFGSGRAGPYDFSYTAVFPVNSSKVLTTGYLSRDGVVLQNQCTTDGLKDVDYSVITPYGIEHGDMLDVDVPAGYIIQYILQNGERFSFNLSSTVAALNPDQIVYHRWVGTVVGGKVGGEQYDGPTIFEWLNPGMTTYTVSSSTGV